MRKKLVIPTQEKKLVQSVRLKPSMRAALQRAVAKHGCTMNALLEAILDDWLREQGFLK
jgi:hypothetical protein